MIIDLAREKNKKEKAVLVTIEEIGKETWKLEDRKEELKFLVKSCGVEPVSEITCRLKVFSPKFLIGKGKVEEIA